MANEWNVANFMGHFKKLGCGKQHYAIKTMCKILPVRFLKWARGCYSISFVDNREMETDEVCKG